MAEVVTRGAPLLTLEGVNLTLGEGKSARLILRDVNAQILDIIREGKRQGQVTGLLGPSGIGKTQLSRIIAGFIQPDSGIVKIGVEQEPARMGRVGVVPQRYHSIPHLTVLGNLVFAGTQSGLTKAEAVEKAGHMLERFGLWEHRTKWPGDLSGGMHQRLVIGQQILVGHRLIFADEPFASLDVRMIAKVIDLFREVTSDDEYLTIIVVTHDIGAAIAISDTLWLMGNKRDEHQQFIPGATIVAQSDLIKEGLAWNPDIRHDPRFLQMEAEVTERFHTLIADK